MTVLLTAGARTRAGLLLLLGRRLGCPGGRRALRAVVRPRSVCRLGGVLDGSVLAARRGRPDRAGRSLLSVLALGLLTLPARLLDHRRGVLDDALRRPLARLTLLEESLH